MAEFPTGTVTFLFTDIEGSTRLTRDLGERYPDVLADHRRALRGISRPTAVEVDTQGDAFFVAFGSAREALAAAAESQEALADGPLRVRIGIHTGEATVSEEGYVGLDVVRGARIAAAAHGGRGILSRRPGRSQATRSRYATSASTGSRISLHRHGSTSWETASFHRSRAPTGRICRPSRRG